MSDLHVPASDSPCVPVRSMLRPSTYRALLKAAEQRGTDVGGLLALMADRAVVAPKPAEQPTGRRRYLQADPELLQRIRHLNTVERMNDAEIGDALGLARHQIAHLRRVRLGLPGHG